MLASGAYAGADRALVVEWQDTSVEIFMTMPSEDLSEIGAAQRTGLARADGSVDYAAIGAVPADIGDGILTEIGLSRDVAGFETMTMMVHDEGERLPFTTPFDAMMASSVCGVPIPTEPVPVSDTSVYLGAFKEMPSDRDGMTLDISGFGGPIDVRVFGYDGQQSRFTADPQGGVVVIERPVSGNAVSKWLILLASALAATAISLVVYWLCAGRWQTRHRPG